MDTDQLIRKARQALTSKDLVKAEKEALKILEVSPYEDRAIHILALVTFKQGIYDLAVEWLEDAIYLRPWQPEYRADITKAYLAMKANYDRAIEHALYLVKIDPTPENFFICGLLHHVKGLYVDAVALFHQSVYGNAALFEDINTIYSSCDEYKRLAGPLHLFKHCPHEYIPVQENGVENIFYRRGLQLHESNRVQMANYLYDASIEINPRHLGALFRKGQVLLVLRMEKDAIGYFYKAAELDNKNPIFLAGILSCWCDLRNEMQVKYYLDVLLDWPERNQLMHIFILLSMIKSLGYINDRRAFKVLDISKSFLDFHQEADEENESQYDYFRSFLFRLGTLNHKIGDYHIAFKTLTRANNLKKARYDFKRESDYIEKIMENYSSLIIQEKRSNNKSEAPIFIIGLPRSGTTLVERIISSHTNVKAGGELEYIPIVVKIISRLQNKDYPDFNEDLNKDILNYASAQYIERLRLLSPEIHKVTDKNLNNYRYLGLINQLLPNS
jgi:tetratricopeptide (TPR) repeat protein